jgi:RNA polymerase-binding transcription factor DksA
MAVKKAAAKKTAAKKSAPKKAVAKKVAPKKAAPRKVTAKKAAAKKAAPKRAAAKKAVPKKVAPKKAVAKKAAPTKAVPKKAAPKQLPINKAAPTKTRVNKTGATKVPPKKVATKKAAEKPWAPVVRGRSKDKIAFTKEFDVKFLRAQRELLQRERVELLGSVENLEDEAQALIDEAEMGDVQFDDEGGEGDTMVVERERDLALSAQHREIVALIDDALARISVGSYGYSMVSGRPIPRERLEAIPWATELVEEKVGGIGRR